MKRRWIILAFITHHPLLDNFAIANRHQHRSVVASETLLVHPFETQEAKVVFAVATKHLWFLYVTGGAERTDCCVADGVVWGGSR